MISVEAFYTQADLESKTEVERVCFLAYFHLRRNNLNEFSAALAATWLKGLNLAAPNLTRLAERLARSHDTVRGQAGGFRLSRKFIGECEHKFPALDHKTQDIQDLGSVLPESLYSGLPGYIRSLAKQINASYENNIFDGCAVLMRRLEEILLILSFQHLGIADEIKKDGLYVMLESIVKNAAANTVLDLSRNSRRTIETIRELGNFSAHKITYTCKKEYIEERRNEFRALIDELLHKAGLKV